MTLFDLETICDDIKTVMQNNLNTELTTITAEKADSITLKAIDSNAYFFQSLNDASVNFDPFVFYLIQSIDDQAAQMPSYSVSKADIAIAVCMEDTGEDAVIGKKLLRYSRALKSIFEKNFDSLRNGAKFIVKSQAPVDVQLSNSSNIHRACGVILTVSFG